MVFIDQQMIVRFIYLTSLAVNKDAKHPRWATEEPTWGQQVPQKKALMFYFNNYLSPRHPKSKGIKTFSEDDKFSKDCKGNFINITSVAIPALSKTQTLKQSSIPATNAVILYTVTDEVDAIFLVVTGPPLILWDSVGKKWGALPRR